MSSLREKLDNTERLNDYLSKQIAIHHVKQGNLDSLLEMAQTINLRKEELDNYKEKLANIHNSNGSLNKSKTSRKIGFLFNYIFLLFNNCGLNQKKTDDDLLDANNNINNNLNNGTPTRQIKVSITTLEKQLDDAKLKYKRLKVKIDSQLLVMIFSSNCVTVRIYTTILNEHVATLQSNSTNILRFLLIWVGALVSSIRFYKNLNNFNLFARYF